MRDQMDDNPFRAERSNQEVHREPRLHDYGQQRSGQRAPQHPQQVQHDLSSRSLAVTQIIKQEWDSTWPDAIKDLAESCKQNQILCENNLEIMLMLSEEIFEDTKQNMTKARLLRLKERYTENLKIIYDLCDFIAKAYIQDQTKISASLIKMCLRVFYAFLSWAPTSLIFATDFLDVILVGLMSDIRLTVQCLQCLTESYSIPINDFSPEELSIIRKKLFDAFTLFTSKLHQILPIARQFRVERVEKLKNHNQLTIFDNITKEVALFFIALVKFHFNWMFETALELYRASNRQWMDICQLLESCLRYMVNMSDVDHDSLYKICLDFWQTFTNKRIQIDSRWPLLRRSQVQGRDEQWWAQIRQLCIRCPRII